jgi:periodic tryptophan protein 1
MAESMITSTCWVPRGFAAQHPHRVELDEDEFDRIAAMAKLQLEDAQEDLEEAEGEGEVPSGVEEEEEEKAEEEDAMEVEQEPSKEADDDDLREYDLGNYDEPTEEEKEAGTCEFFVSWIGCCRAGRKR